MPLTNVDRTAKAAPLAQRVEADCATALQGAGECVTGRKAARRAGWSRTERADAGDAVCAGTDSRTYR